MTTGVPLFPGDVGGCFLLAFAFLDVDAVRGVFSFWFSLAW